MHDIFGLVENAKERKRLHCIECKRLTIHNLEARCKSGWRDDHNHESGGSKYSIFRCGACDAICYETVSWDSYDVDYDENGDSYAVESAVQYPAPVSAHFNFNTESTPRKLDVILDEMLYAMAGNKLLLATVGLRFAVEFIVKDKKCAGRTLEKKIDDLHTQGMTDADQTDLLHQIRKRGNASAHEAVGMNAKELVAGMSVIEGLLEKLYNGPARHEKTMTKAKQLLKVAPKDPVSD